MNQPTLFLLEDSRELFSEVLEITNRLGWQVEQCTSLEPALAAMRRCKGEGITAMLLDIMVPKDQLAFKSATELSNERIKKSLELTETKDSQVRTDILGKLRSIDKQMQVYVIVDGGILFLETIAKEKIIQPSTKIAFFSALRPDTAVGSGISFRERVTTALGKSEDEWFRKPVDPQRIEEWLNTCAAAK
jgi:hypothetical protein